MWIAAPLQECLTRRLKLLERLAFDLRIIELEILYRLDDGRGDDDPREPLVVRGHHVPRRIVAAGFADHVLIGLHVFRPELALGDVAHGKLPALVGFFDALEEAFSLLVPRDIQEELEDERAVAREMLLEGADVVEAMLPDVLAVQFRRQLLPLHEFGMHADDQLLLVMRAVEDADAPTLGKLPRNAPEEVVVEFL